MSVNYLTLNPYTMKSNFHPKFYFSAYPLKALNLPEEEEKSYLHIYHDSDGHINRAGSSKVLPMINPYKAATANIQAVAKTDPTDHVEERDTEWFASYE